MIQTEQPMISVKYLNKQFGPGCPHCMNPESRKLHKNFCTVCHTVYSCQDVSFDLYPGEIIGVVGESGSGKSTMMRCLYFDQEATSGEVYLQAYKDGSRNLFAESTQQKRYIRNHLMGKVYQNPMLGLRMDFTSIGNIAEKMIAAGSRRVSEMEDRGMELLEKVHIPLHRIKEAPKHFSGGCSSGSRLPKRCRTVPRCCCSMK